VPPPSRLAAVAATGAAALAVTACRPAAVDLAFRPRVGAPYHYQVRVRTITTLRLADNAPERSDEESVLDARQTVIGTGPDGVRVRVELRVPGLPVRTFVVRFDRDAQLTGIESVEGLPASILGTLGLPELFPGGAAGPPRRRLAPGERWSISRRLQLAESGRGRLEGSGHLVELRRGHGRDLALVHSHTRLPVTTNVPRQGGTLAMNGVEVADIDATRDVGDGSVDQASSDATGTFAVSLTRVGGTPLPGTLVVEVRSQTRRVR